jgi:two-component system chemotaxis response regulator CheB
MPWSAITQVETDYSVRAADIGSLLTMLARHPVTPGEQPEASFFSRLEAELDIAAGEYALERGFTRLGQVSTLTCPECHGSLVRIEEGDMLRFRCHTGHAFSADALAKSVGEDAIQTCEQSLRALEESAMLLEMTGRHFDKAGRRKAAEQYFQRAERARMQARALHEWLTEQERVVERIERAGD